MTSSRTSPGVVMQPLTLCATQDSVYALRDDGAVFVLLKRGSFVPDAEGRPTPADAPHWRECPAIPGTVRAIEQAG